MQLNLLAASTQTYRTTVLSLLLSLDVFQLQIDELELTDNVYINSVIANNEVSTPTGDG